MRRLATTGALLVVMASSACVDRQVVRPVDPRSMTPAEVAAGLASRVFRDVLAARAQLDRLSDADWLEALRALSRDPDPDKRLMAVVELSRRPVEEAREAIRALEDDPDEAVRAEARSRSRPPPPAPPGGVP